MNCCINPCAGPQLIPGPPGRPGLPGPAGAQGPQGVPGPGYPYNVLTANNDYQTVLSQNFVTYDIGFANTVLEINPKVERVGSSRFRILEDGVYRIYWKFRLTMSGTLGFWVVSLRESSGGSGLTAGGAGVQDGGTYRYNFQDQVIDRFRAGMEIYVRPWEGSYSSGETYRIEDAYISIEKVAD